MAVWDTAENKRTDFTRRTIQSLFDTVDFRNHRLIISDNGSCDETWKVYADFNIPIFSAGRVPETKAMVIKNDSNLGTAEAINKAWIYRVHGENAIKMDNDVVIHYKNWIEDMEEAIRRDPLIGIVGLKRKDCWENPEHPDPFYRSLLKMLHEPGKKWMIAEYVSHVMGTCQMYSSALLDKIGYLYQIGLYGFDDSFAAFRCTKAGMRNAFLPHIEIDHIDPGGTEYQKWKEEVSGKVLAKEYRETVNGYMTGKKDIYYNPFL